MLYTFGSVKKEYKTTISDLRPINIVLGKVKMRKSKICFCHDGVKDHLQIIRIGDASYNTRDKSIGGISMFLTVNTITHFLPLNWKLKQIEKVTQFSKHIKTLNISKVLDDVVHVAHQLEILNFGDCKKRIPVHF